MPSTLSTMRAVGRGYFGSTGSLSTRIKRNRGLHEGLEVETRRVHRALSDTLNIGENAFRRRITIFSSSALFAAALTRSLIALKLSRSAETKLRKDSGESAECQSLEKSGLATTVGPLHSMCKSTTTSRAGPAPLESSSEGENSDANASSEVTGAISNAVIFMQRIILFIVVLFLFSQHFDSQHYWGLFFKFERYKAAKEVLIAVNANK